LWDFVLTHNYHGRPLAAAPPKTSHTYTIKLTLNGDEGKEGRRLDGAKGVRFGGG
jgi:hypothetical protein